MIGIRTLLAVGLSILLGTPSIAGDEPFFPPSVFFTGPKDEFFQRFIDQHISSQLKALKEPSLWQLSRKDRAATAYRFLWLASNQHPVCTSITRNGEDVTLRLTRHDASPGNVEANGEKPRITLDRTIKLKPPQWEEIVRLADRSRFWVAATEVKENRGIADGDMIVIEGIRDGKYHVIVRAGSTAGDDVKSLCRSMLEPADRDILKVWDTWRSAERKPAER